MFFSTKIRYGIRALMEIGLNGNKQPMLLKEISKKQNISMKYLDHIFAQLKTKGIIKRIKAKKGGGYLLAKNPKEITIFDVIEAIEGTKRLECIIDKSICPRINKCGARIVWKKINDEIDNILKSFTIEDFIKEQKKIREIKEPIMFSI